MARCPKAGSARWLFPLSRDFGVAFQKLFGALFLCVLMPALVACNRAPESPATEPQYSTSAIHNELTEYVIAVHPLHNPQKLHEVFGPLVKYLNEQVPDARFRLEASVDYAAYDKRLGERSYHFALPNPYQTVVAMRRGYRVIAKMGRDEDFKGVFVVRRDSGVKSIADLKGKVVAYPAPTALAAAMLPQMFLYSNGLDVMREVDNKYVGSQESSIMNVYLGSAAAGATWPPPWRSFVKDHPEKAKELRIIWETPALVNNSFMVRDDVPAPIAEAVRKTLIGLSDHEAGRAILARMETCCIDAASDKDYDAVKAFLREFGEKVRPLPE